MEFSLVVPQVDEKRRRSLLETPSNEGLRCRSGSVACIYRVDDGQPEKADGGSEEVRSIGGVGVP